MISTLTVIHVIVCFFLILVVLLQKGKGQDIGSAFGGGGTQTAFGARSGATLLTKLTAVMAAVFMLTSITLTILISRPGRVGRGIASGGGAAPGRRPGRGGRPGRRHRKLTRARIAEVVELADTPS